MSLWSRDTQFFQNIIKRVVNLEFCQKSLVDCVHLWYITYDAWRVIFQILKLAFLIPLLEKMQDKQG